MGKKVGGTVTVKSPSGYDGTPSSKGTGGHNQGSHTITKVFDHGVRTKEQGYVNNKRITGYTPPPDSK